MGFLPRLFTLEEIRDMDLRDLEILRTAIQYVLRTDDEIRIILERRVREIHTRLKQTSPPQAPSTP
jgi:hypothetical protein